SVPWSLVPVMGHAAGGGAAAGCGSLRRERVTALLALPPHWPARGRLQPGVQSSALALSRHASLVLALPAKRAAGRSGSPFRLATSPANEHTHRGNSASCSLQIA